MPASPSTARALNDRLALRLLQDEGPLTAGQLKQLTGLSRPTVADLVERLTASGLIEVVGETGARRRGPNAKLYGIVAGRAQLAALDVRTEGVAVLVSDLVGRVLAEASVPIGDDTGTGPAVEQAVTLVERVVKEAGADRLHTVGIGAPGLIDPASGELRNSTGLPAWHRRLVAALQERLPEARVSVENETNLAALAEQREGAARDRDTFVLLWLGHGTGAAVVLDGTLRRGASGGTGEIGFLPVPGTSGLPSATDCEGGFHSLAGSAAVVALAAEHGLPAPPPSDEPGAAAVVRTAVTAVLAGEYGGGGAAGLPDGRGGGGAMGVQEGDRAGAATGERLGAGGGGLAESAGEGVAGSPGGGGAGLAGGGSAGLTGDGVAGLVGEGVAGSPGEGSAGWAGGGLPGVVGGGAGEGSAGATGRGAAGSPGGGAAGPADGGVAGSPGGGPAGPPPGDPAGLVGAGAPEGAAGRFLDALADRLAIGAASVVAVLDPGCVVLGGEVGLAGGEVLAARVEERLRRMAPLPTEVRPSVLGGGAVLRGALLTARESAQEELFGTP